MNNLLLLPFVSICMFPPTKIACTEKSTNSHYVVSPKNIMVNTTANSPMDGCYDMMPAVEFKNQQYCRVELPDFDFDAKFTIVGASVLFSGAGFEPGVVKKEIKTSSLDPLSIEMKKCRPGSIIIFEKVKVIGPDKILRSIQGKNIKLF